MTALKFYTVNVPFFPGFYESSLDHMLDHEAESFVEYRTSEYDDCDESESKWPADLRLAESDLSDAIYYASEWSKAHEMLARDYAETLDYKLGELFGLSVTDTRQGWNSATRDFVPEKYQRDSIRSKYESYDSPREYNFTTDRLYIDVPVSVVRLWFKLSKENGHKVLAESIAERFTSYDGFRSFYPNTLESWLAKPLDEWDHNELGTLMGAAIRIAGGDELPDDVIQDMLESEIGYQAFEAGMNWERYESELTEKRAAKLAEWVETDKDSALAWRAASVTNAERFDSLVAVDPGAFGPLADDLPALPYRCPETVDLFTGKAG